VTFSVALSHPDTAILNRIWSGMMIGSGNVFPPPPQ
jgi:hypothetical protein